MSNNLPALAKEMKSLEPKFKATSSAVDFQAELGFAIQALENNYYLQGVAENNIRSLRSAIINVGSIGLSLNPALGHAYLVPRDGRVLLDVSYKGLIELGTRSGGIISASAELVRANDHFRWKGKHQQPEHDFDPFADEAERGAIRGVYSTAELPNGSFLIEKMSWSEIEKVREVSSSWKAFKAGKAKSSIWNDWEEPMILKSVIKKSSKTWPGASQSLGRAIQYLNTEAGEGVAEEKVINPEAEESVADDRKIELQETAMTAYEKAIERDNAFQAAREWVSGKVDSVAERNYLLRCYDKLVETNPGAAG